MGLFGYNKRAYDKNTRRFTNRIETYIEVTAWPDVRKLLNQVVFIISEYPYPKGKELKAIDKRIDGLLQKIGEAIESGNQYLAVEYGVMLLSAVVDSRQFGREKYSKEELELREQWACMGAELKQLFDQAVACDKRKDEVKTRVKELDPTSVEYKKLESELASLESQRNFLLERIEGCQRNFAAFEDNKREKEMREIEQIIESLGITSAEELKDSIAKFDSELSAALESDRAKKAYDSIQGSSPDPFGFDSLSAGSNADPFGDAK